VDPVKFWAGPFQSLCHTHHSATKQREEKRGYDPLTGKKFDQCLGRIAEGASAKAALKAAGLQRKQWKRKLEGDPVFASRVEAEIARWAQKERPKGVAKRHGSRR
jgi:hypothetical protein